MMGLRFAGVFVVFLVCGGAPVFILSVLLDIHLILMLLNISAILVWMTSVL